MPVHGTDAAIEVGRNTGLGTRSGNEEGSTLGLDIARAGSRPLCWVPSVRLELTLDGF